MKKQQSEEQLSSKPLEEIMSHLSRGVRIYSNADLKNWGLSDGWWLKVFSLYYPRYYQIFINSTTHIKMSDIDAVLVFNAFKLCYQLPFYYGSHLAEVKFTDPNWPILARLYLRIREGDVQGVEELLNLHTGFFGVNDIDDLFSIKVADYCGSSPRRWLCESEGNPIANELYQQAKRRTHARRTSAQDTDYSKHLALMYNQVEAIKQMFTVDNVNIVISYSGEPPLFYAPYLSDSALNHLLEKGANIHVEAANGKNILHSFCAAGDLERLERFLDRGVKPTVNSKISLLHEFIVGATAEIKRVTYDFVLRSNPSLFQFFKNLVSCRQTELLKMITKLIDGSVARANLICNKETLLGLAVTNNCKLVVEHLIQQGASVDLCDDEFRKIPLHGAVILETEEIVRVLLANQREVNTQDFTGNTALHCAIKMNCLKMIDLLLEKKPDVTIVNQEDETVMQLAVQMGNLAIISSLLQFNIDQVRYLKKETLWRLVILLAEAEQWELIKKINIVKNIVNVKDNYGRTLLWYAESRKNVGMITYLVNHNADLNNICNDPPRDFFSRAKMSTPEIKAYGETLQKQKRREEAANIAAIMGNSGDLSQRVTNLINWYIRENSLKDYFFPSVITESIVSHLPVWGTDIDSIQLCTIIQNAFSNQLSPPESNTTKFWLKKPVTFQEISQNEQFQLVVNFILRTINAARENGSPRHRRIITQ